MTEQKHSACPFCGGEVDPTGWLRGEGVRGPECDGCGATAPSMEVWEQRAALAQPSPAPDHFTHADKKLEALLNATALVIESPGHDAAHYWAECMREYDEAHSPAPELEPLIPDNIPRFVFAEGRMSQHGSGTWMRDSWLHLIQDQHDRIVGALRAEWSEVRQGLIAQRYAAQARVEALEKQEPVALANRGHHAFWVKWTDAAAGLYGPDIKLYAAPVAQAGQVPEALREGFMTSCSGNGKHEVKIQFSNLPAAQESHNFLVKLIATSVQGGV